MNIFIPLGRLTYCAYLINPIIISVLYLGADISAHSDILMQVIKLTANKYSKSIIEIKLNYRII